QRRRDHCPGVESGAVGEVRGGESRGRLPRACGAQGAFALAFRGPCLVTAAQIRFLTLSRREVSRFMKIKKQTIGAPLLETFLYISVFGAALGSRIDELHGIDYVV